MNRLEIKNRIAFKIWTAVPRIENYKIGGAAVQILDNIRLIIFHADSFTRGQSNMRRFIYERSATNIRDWSLAYSFIFSTNIFFFLIYLLNEKNDIENTKKYNKTIEYRYNGM